MRQDDEQTPRDGAATPLEQKLREASALSDEGQWGDAFELLHQQEAEHPQDPTLLCMLGIAAQELDADDAAYDYFRRTLAAGPADPLILVSAGAALARFDDPEAESALRLAALSAPHLAMTRLYYGSYLAREGQLELALDELRAARELDPDNPQVHHEMGRALLIARRTGEGVEQLEQAVTLSDDPEIRLLHGLGLLRQGTLVEAAEEVHRASLALLADGEAQLLAALTAATQLWEGEAWDALARAEAAAYPPSEAMLREVEEALGAGAEAVEHLLLQELAPALLHERLFARL